MASNHVRYPLDQSPEKSQNKKFKIVSDQSKEYDVYHDFLGRDTIPTPRVLMDLVVGFRVLE